MPPRYPWCICRPGTRVVYVLHATRVVYVLHATRVVYMPSLLPGVVYPASLPWWCIPTSLPWCTSSHPGYTTIPPCTAGSLHVTDPPVHECEEAREAQEGRIPWVRRLIGLKSSQV